MTEQDKVVRRAHDDHRLDRIERKIDQLSEAMIALARAEEKLMNIERNHMTTYDRLNRHSEKLDEVDNRLIIMEKTNAIVTKLWWIAISVAAASLGSHFISIGG